MKIIARGNSPNKSPNDQKTTKLIDESSITKDKSGCNISENDPKPANEPNKRKQRPLSKQMEEWCDLIFDNCPDTHITISSLLTRSDMEGKKVAEVNNELKLLCSKNNLSFLLHANIDKECLNKSGLHLNKLGDSTLAKNLIETIKHF